MCLALCPEEKDLTSRTLQTSEGEQHLLQVEADDMIEMRCSGSSKGGHCPYSVHGVGVIGENAICKWRSKR